MAAPVPGEYGGAGALRRAFAAVHVSIFNPECPSSSPPPATATPTPTQNPSTRALASPATGSPADPASPARFPVTHTPAGPATERPADLASARRLTRRQGRCGGHAGAEPFPARRDPAAAAERELAAASTTPSRQAEGRSGRRQGPDDGHRCMPSSPCPSGWHQQGHMIFSLS